MKIEKISEDVIKVTLSVSDLETRNLDAKKLKSNSPQYEKLLLDIIGHAEIEFGFDISECKVVYEPAVNKQGEHIITVTRTSNRPNSENVNFVDFNPVQFFKVLSMLRELMPVDEHFEYENDGDEPHTDEIARVDDFLRSLLLTEATEKTTEKTQKKDTPEDSYEVIYFSDFENLIQMATSFPQSKMIPATLYKYNKAYYVSYRVSKRNAGVIDKLRGLASEFDGKFMPPDIVLPILEEHGDKIIKRGAFSVLLKNFQ